jgi:L-malate glycosyltransferase
VLTVLFSTRDAAAHLRDVLSAFTRLEVPAGGWQLLIADNCSVDGTRQIIESFRDRLPLRCFAESRPGKNVALNAGLALVDGDLVVLTDDDVFPRSDWLVQLRAAADAHEQFDVFGGAVLPKWETPPPPWLMRRVPAGPTYTLTDTSLADGPTGAHNIFGPNMAIRSSVFAQGARFETSIGPSGRNYAMGSETELVRRLLRQGHQAWYVREAVVEHFIRKSQMNQRWVLRRAQRFGRGQYRLSRATESAPQRTWRGIPRYLYRKLLGEIGRTLLAAASMDGDRLFRARWSLNYIRGQMVEAGIIHRDERGAASAATSRGGLS